MKRSSGSRLRFLRGAVVGALVLGAGAGVGWAAATVFRPPADDIVEATYTLVQVEHGTVSSSVGLTVGAEWTVQPAGVNRATGVVTAISVGYGDNVGTGTELYRVDERPVLVAAGAVPAYRDMAPGSAGRDVAQLQTLLTEVGLYTGPIDGKMGAGTVAATKAWQRGLGVADTGVVAASDLVFVPALPARIALDGEVVAPGASVTGGEPVVNVLSQAPVFTAAVTDTQAAQIPVGTTVEVGSEGVGGPWSARVESYATGADGGPIAVLVGADGSAVCAAECDVVPALGRTIYSAQALIVRPVEGLVVPSAALVTLADGATAVVAEDGARVPVEVSASARGMSVVEGIEAGAQVRVPATG